MSRRVLPGGGASASECKPLVSRQRRADEDEKNYESERGPSEARGQSDDMDSNGNRSTLRAIVANVVFRNLFDAKGAAPVVQLPDYPLSPHLQLRSAGSPRVPFGWGASREHREERQAPASIFSLTYDGGFPATGSQGQAGAAASGSVANKSNAATPGANSSGNSSGLGSGLGFPRQFSSTSSVSVVTGVPTGHPNAAARRKDISRCRVLRSTIHSFEEEFTASHGHKPHGHERAPLAEVYTEYRQLKQTVRDSAARHIQAVYRGHCGRLEFKRVAKCTFARRIGRPPFVFIFFPFVFD